LTARRLALFVGANNRNGKLLMQSFNGKANPSEVFHSSVRNAVVGSILVTPGTGSAHDRLTGQPHSMVGKWTRSRLLVQVTRSAFLVTQTPGQSFVGRAYGSCSIPIRVALSRQSSSARSSSYDSTDEGISCSPSKYFPFVETSAGSTMRRASASPDSSGV
jgi:hypothetical protein